MKRKLLTIAAGMSLSIAVFAIIIWIGGLGEASWICSRDIDGWLRACWRDRRQLTRRAKGLCAACGYDLRESAGRCPECGSSKDIA